MSERSERSKTCGGDGRCLEKQGDGRYTQRAKWICATKCIPVECPNFVVCLKRAPQWYFSQRYGLCQVCLDTFGRKLHIVDNPEKESCAVCYEESDKRVEFPTDCNHFFCGKCCAELLFYDETRYHLSPVPFGCVKCPNGCENPKRGRQCGCSEYDEVIEEWMEESPADASRWQNSELLSIENSDDMAYGSRKCPLCRQRVEND